MDTWLEPQQSPAPPSFAHELQVPELLARILQQRGFRSVPQARAFLDPLSYSPASPFELPGMQAAVERLLFAIDRNERICVWGDFDVDGQTSTTLLVSALRDLGARVSYHIPVRADESHGVNQPVLQELIERGMDLLLTCDTGISSHQALEYAYQQGVAAIITDHHSLPSELPPAVAAINPKMLPEDHPLGSLPGVGVAYQLAVALLGQAEKAEPYLDLVALGIVADLAELTADTRYLLQRGLPVLREARRPGLRSLYQLAELNPEHIAEQHIGFVIAPRLNALGRLADANVAVEFLTTGDDTRARILASELEGLNARRRLMTDQVYQAALSQVERDPSLLEDAALVLAHPGWPAGVIGIVANRLVEHFYKPTVLISAPAGQIARGSARSVEGVNITQAIAAQEGLLQGFGGHPMAAGLSIEPERIPEFRRALSRTIRQGEGFQPREPVLQIDEYQPLSGLSLDLVAALEPLAPFGPGNPPLVLVARSLAVESFTSIGRGDQHLKLTLQDESGQSHDVLWWNGEQERLPLGRFDLAYTPRTSNFRGVPELQVEWLGARPVEAEEIVLRSRTARPQVIDYRQVEQPLGMLEMLQENEPELSVWCEASTDDVPTGQDRTRLAPADDLAIWTAPPSRRELQAALELVRPRRVYLFALDPGVDRLNPFLQRLAGLVKHALNARDGLLRLSQLAAAAAQQETTVRLGLEWLAAQGHIRILETAQDELKVATGDGVIQPQAGELAERLRSLLQETAAYRAYFREASQETLFS